MSSNTDSKREDRCLLERTEDASVLHLIHAHGEDHFLEHLKVEKETSPWTPTLNKQIIDFDRSLFTFRLEGNDPGIKLNSVRDSKVTLIQFRDQEWNRSREEAQNDHCTETMVTAFSGFGVFDANCEGHPRAINNFTAKVTIEQETVADRSEYPFGRVDRDLGPLYLKFDPSSSTTKDVSFTGKKAVWTCKNPFGSDCVKPDPKRPLGCRVELLNKIYKDSQHSKVQLHYICSKNECDQASQASRATG